MMRWLTIYSKHVLFSVALVIVLLVPHVTHAYSSPGKATGYVNDFAQILTEEQRSALEATLTAFNASTTNEITVVTVKNLGGDYIENYAVELFKEWGVGTKKNDNGVLLLIALDDRIMRIEVGYGLEGLLTDAISSQIIRNDLTPAFKQGDYFGGIHLAVDHIIQVTEGEYKSDRTSDSKSSSIPFEGIIITVLVISQFLGAILARSKSWWAGGIIGAAVGGVLTFFQVLGMTFTFGVILTIILTLLGLLFDYIISNRYTQSVNTGSSIPWWAGGGSGRGGGISFGGFGGGSSGGGGASGRW